MSHNDSDQPLGSDQRPLRVAIVGSGPSGFYAAEHLLKSDTAVDVHMFERLPAPFGLVRFGVAPDHGKIRNVIKTYEKTAARDGYHFWGNVTIGRDLRVDELHDWFDAVVYAFGAQTDRKLNIPGIELERSYTATAFCAWYNGHPDYRDCAFDLSQEVAVVIGQGNVAMDVVRILAKQADDLRSTDIATHAVDQLAESKVREIHCVGRRGPAQAAFTPKEIHELGEIPGCDIIVDPADLELNEASAQELELPDRSANQRNMETLREFAQRESTGAARKIVLHFFRSPTEIEGNGAVERVTLETNRLSGEAGAQKARGTGETEPLDCGVFFRSVGYHGEPIDGVPFDADRGVIPSDHGRVAIGDYAVGWIKRGPSGLIGTNKKGAEETVQRLLEDIPQMTPAPRRDDVALAAMLGERGVRVITYSDWKVIDAAEIARGEKAGKPRDNFVTVDEMIAVLDG